MNELLAWRTNNPSTICDDLTAEAFDTIAKIAYDHAGLSMARSKMTLVKSRIVRRLRDLKLSSFEEYVRLVEQPEADAERQRLISALTTNVSHFFRENNHLDLLRTSVLPGLLEKAGRGGKVRIWSAGCSNGQEPYSIAMTLAVLAPDIAARNVRILATDVDEVVLNFAREGRYPLSMMESVPAHFRTRFFAPGDQPVTEFLVDQSLAGLISFKQLNLHGPWPMTGKFDIIFCRNVMIYFDEPTQQRLLSRFLSILSPRGWLMLGHSERLPSALAPSFHKAGTTAFQKLPD